MLNHSKWNREWVESVQHELDIALEQAKSRSADATGQDTATAKSDRGPGKPDPDITLIGNYLNVNMTAEELLAVEERLERDPAFRKKVTPLIWMWESPLSFTPPSERRTWKEIFGDDHDTDGPGGGGGGNAPTTPGSSTRGTPLRDAAGTEVVFVPQAPLRRRMAWVIVMSLFTLFIFSGVNEAGKWSLHQRGWHSRDEKEVMRAPTGMFAKPRVRNSADDSTVVVDVTDQVKVSLGKQSRLTSDGVSGAGSGTAVAVALDGDGVFDIAPAAGSVTVWTYASKLLLAPGRYAVRSAPGDTVTRITIGDGQVTAPDGATFTSGHLVAGRGQIRTTQASAGFPVLPGKAKEARP